MLSIAEQILKTLGYTIIPVQTILPNLLSKKEDEVLTSLSKQYKKDIELGVNILNHNSQFDIGQSIVIKNGRIVGIEGIEGTKELIKRCGKYCQIAKQNQEKPVLVKASKLGQNMKLDVPTIGIDTIKDLINNNFAGIAIENNSVFMLEKDKIKSLAKKNNLFIKII